MIDQSGDEQIKLNSYEKLVFALTENLAEKLQFIFRLRSPISIRKTHYYFTSYDSSYTIKTIVQSDQVETIISRRRMRNVNSEVSNTWISSAKLHDQLNFIRPGTILECHCERAKIAEFHLVNCMF